MIDKDIKERSRVLRTSLDQGYINLKELRAFLVTVEADLPPITSKQAKIQEGRARAHAFLSRPNRRIKKT